MARKKLNSLDRFRKQSPKLVVDEMTSALGCAGVVLRWRDPLAAQPVEIYLYSPGKSELFIDGQPFAPKIRNGQGDIAPGPHQLAIRLDKVDLSGGLFMFALSHQPRSQKSTMPEGMKARNWRFVSSIPTQWRAITEPPIETSAAWTSAEFNDDAWPLLQHTTTRPRVVWSERGAYELHFCLASNADFLALPPGATGTGSVWIRAKIVVPSPLDK